jgi:hypothetical protein
VRAHTPFGDEPALKESLHQRGEADGRRRHEMASWSEQTNVSKRSAVRLGHKNIAITLGIYGHVHPSMQEDAARKMGALLHGSSRGSTQTGPQEVCLSAL